MVLEQWALILFTLLAQMSVGSFWVLGAVHYYANRKAGEEEADRMSDRALLAVGPLLILALLASLLHLGDPLNAFRAVANISSSWLSREILTGVLFAIFGGLFAILQWRKIGSTGLRSVLAVLAAIIGFFLILSMSMVYMLPTQPSWDTIATPIGFFSTTLLLGSLAMGVAFTANYLFTLRKEEEGQEVQLQLLRGSIRGIAVTSLLMLTIQLVVAPIYIATLSTGEAAAQESASMLTGDYSTVFILRLVLSVVGAGLFAALLYQGASGETKVGTLANLAFVAFAIVLVAEVMGRYLFYAIQVPIGI
jgi:anaerobic dimethyl sulfoxide reductase subunit C (anchor subunit)